MLIKRRNQLPRLSFAILFLLIFPLLLAASQGSFFLVDKDVIDQVYYLDMTEPPQIKRVVFAPGNKPQTVVAEGGFFDLSRNGRLLVYHYRGRLWLSRTDKADKPLLTQGEGTRPKWSPNGELIAYVGRFTNNVETIMIMDKQGEDTEVLLKIDRVINFFWENNGDSIISVVKRKENFYLIRVSPDGSKDAIYQFPNDIVVEDCALSPNGKKLAYVSRSSIGSRTVFLIDLNIYRLFRLTRPYIDCSGLSWSPDSKTLIYSGDDILYTSRGSKGNAYRLQKGVKFPRWSRNGSKILYVKANDPSSIALYSVTNDYIQEMDLGKAAKENLILLEKQVALTDIKAVKTKGDISYSLKGELERRKVTEGMLLPFNSVVRTDPFNSAEFQVGDDIEVTLTPRTEMKINVSQDNGYFEDIQGEQELVLRVLEGQVNIVDKGQQMVVNAGEEYVLSLAKAAQSAGSTTETFEGVPATLLLQRIENQQGKTGGAAKKNATASLSVDHPHEVDVWGSDCSECHPGQPDWRRVDYKTVKFTTKAATTCINCHRPGESFEGRSVENKHNFLDDPERCLDCHREKPIPGIDTYRTVTFTDSIITLCYACHGDEDIGSSHPVGMVPKIKKYISNVKTPDTVGVMEIPPDMHLDENGLMTCATCHTIHGNWRGFEKPYAKEKPLGEIFGQEYYRTFFLRRNNFNSGLCQACHGQAGY